MATPTIPNGEEYFFPIIYEGNGGGQRVGKFVPFTDSGTIDNSVIYNRADTPKLARTPSSDGNRRTFTISFWYKPTDLGTRRVVFSADTSGSDYFYWEFDASNKIDLAEYSGPSLRLQTNRTFEDTSKFYHFMLAVDTTQSTASDRLKLYVDGDQVTSFAVETYPSQNFDTNVNSTSYPMAVGSFNSLTTLCTGGYLAEYNFVDGTALTPSTFGVTDTSTGRWIPKTLSGITYGTNGFRLKFQDSSALGDDTSGNGNDLTATNLASTDQTTDSPTQNFATMSPSRKRGSLSLSEGNLKMVSTTTDYAATIGTLRLSTSDTTGFYCECKQVGSRRDAMSALIMKESVNVNGLGNNQSYTGTVGIKTRGSGGSNQYWYTIDGNEEATTGVSHALNDYVQIAVKEGKVWMGINNTWLLSGDPANGTNPLFENPFGNEDFRIMFVTYQNNDLEINFGQKSFNYTPPTGFVALQQDNLPETAKGIVGLTWIKDRDNAYSHGLRDSSRGRHKDIFSNLTQAEVTNTDGVQRFLKGGIEIEDLLGLNASGASIVAWNWVANGGTTASNTNGSITSTVQANTTAGFSIVQWTGDNASSATVGHGLSSAPEWILIKNMSDGTDWWVYHKSLTADNNLKLNTTDAQGTFATGKYDHSGITSSVMTLAQGSSSANSINGATDSMIAYCWHGVEGFSKFGKYTANGNADGPFVYTGFRPAFTMIKNINSTYGWIMEDSKRNPFNPIDNYLYANATDAEASTDHIDFLSNGFKIRFGTGSAVNNGTDTYIYMAFAEHPFVGDGTNPVTAR